MINPRIAIIDSGINPEHFHVNGIAGGISIFSSAKGNVYYDEDFRDNIGHGTAVAGIIRGKVPQAAIWTVKIFQNELRASAVTLLTAIEWAIENDMQIIHLSLGTERKNVEVALKRLCDQAREKNIVVVAAGRSPEDNILPSSFTGVIGVYWNRQVDETSLIHHPDSPVAFGAYGRPRPLPGLPQVMNFQGHSFATAHVTGLCGRLIENNPGSKANEIEKMLIDIADN